MGVSGGREVKGRFGGMSPELGLRSALGQVGTGPDPTDLFLSTPVVIIPELVIPNQQVASVQVSPWLQILSFTLAPGDTGPRPLGPSAAPKMF